MSLATIPRDGHEAESRDLACDTTRHGLEAGRDPIDSPLVELLE